MLIVIPTNLDKPPADRTFLLDMIIMGFYAIGVGASLYLAFTNGFWLQRFRTSNDGLQIMASATAVQGEVDRRTLLDSMWLHLEAQANIFNGDKVQTESQSEVGLQLGKNLEVLIKEKSKLQLGITDGIVQFRLSEGEILITVLQDQSIGLQRGAQSDSVLVRKGAYSLKVDPVFGVQLSVAQPLPQPKRAMELAGKADKPTPATEEAKVKLNAKKPLVDIEDPATPNPENVSAKIKLALPTPEADTVFFGSRQEDLVIAAQRTCIDACNLKIFKNHQLWKSADFKTAEETIFRLPSKDLEVGLYDWVFTSETKEYRSRFTVKEFSDDEFSRALEKELPIEIQ